MNQKQLETWAPWGLLVATLLIWQAACSLFNVSEFVFPSPQRIWEQMVEYRDVIAGHAWRTFWVTMVGFGIAIVVGVLLGFVIGSSRLAYAAVYPLMTGFNALPKAAFVPILVVWFGIGVGPAILTAFLISFFPIMVNIATGLATLEPELEDVLRVLGAKRWESGLAPLHALLLRLTQSGHHLGVCGHHRVRDDRCERRHWLLAHFRRLGHANGLGLCRLGGGGRHGHDHVRAVQHD
jgi:ABC-type anion transport system duplicated permease subunit